MLAYAVGEPIKKSYLPRRFLDFWRVILADKTEKRLLLYAEMKLPGQAWLEWEIITEDNQYYLKQQATFRPQGLSGRLYWYLLHFPHQLIFRGMAKNNRQWLINYRNVFKKCAINTWINPNIRC